ncbi:hypothetical protein BDB00DRAFT_877309 [Zychaea mexicana]|uniref:uncharacterized protein n=1 Tax=Zychaea mexicana TaxID=64656 RepID=UPI0022FE6760|nr:uncharacterized protein BDB00DRAFT_877309 [Zychaea mexicana]KAI9488522.1 hypothetical protein BDB00DRAFT_877309 [Zychaea mexicana]
MPEDKNDLDDATLIQEYQRLEEDFFYNFLRSDQQHLLNTPDLHDAFLFGEIGFLVAGLKPCVLIDLPPAVARLYKQHVLDRVAESEFARRDIQVTEIQANISSPEMMSLQGCFIVYHMRQAPQPLLSPSNSDDCGRVIITEATLANILDYPGSLPTSMQQVMSMLEVVYYTREQGGRVQILTMFAALEHEVEQVKAHFKRYYDICREKLAWDIKLLIRRPQ